MTDRNGADPGWGGGQEGTEREQKKRRWSGSVMGEKILFSIKGKINVKKV